MTTSTAALPPNWRLISIEKLDPDSPANFDVNSLLPPNLAPPYSLADIQSLDNQIKQRLRSGDAEGALRMALECVASGIYGAESAVKDAHLQTVTEVLSSIKALEMAPLLKRIYESPGGVELCDVLAKYLYKGMASPSSSASKSVTPQPTGALTTPFTPMPMMHTGMREGSGALMSVLLSWHEKVVDLAGVGCLERVMCDRRTV